MHIPKCKKVVVEGITISLPEQTQSLIYDYIEVMDAILDREEKGGEVDA